MRKAIIILFILTLSGFLAWQVHQKATVVKKAPPSIRKTSAVAVDVAPVRQAVMLDTGMFTGSLYARSQFVAAAKVSGRLKKLYVNMADTVENGQLIAVLDDEEYIQHVEHAKAELDVARANLEESRHSLGIAERELERVRLLHQKKIVSLSELDAKEAEFNSQIARYKVTQAQVAQQEATLKAAEVLLSYTRVWVSWENGGGRWVIGERFVDEGAMLAVNSPIVSVLDTSSLMAVIHVTESEYYKVKTGQEIKIRTDALAGMSFTGRVVRIAPLLKESSREARVEIEVPNREGVLKPNMFVRVKIEFDRHENATVVPLSALTSRDGGQGVFVADLDSGTAHYVPVKLGIVNSDLAEITEPRVSGWVVTLGQHLLEDGAAIIVPEKKIR